MTTALSTDWTNTTLRVRYAETDQMGIVYYANYLVWFELGRTDFCRQRGFRYRDTGCRTCRRAPLVISLRPEWT